jgi:DNA-binding NtrC family response regulator
MKKRHRILVIDDSPNIHQDFRKVLCSERQSAALDEAEAQIFGHTTHLGKQMEFDVDSAFQGQEGLAKVFHAIQEGRPYEMAFVDVRMPPGWDGIEVAPRLWIADPELHIVICTAYSDYTWEEMFEKLGMSDRMLILKKPFERDEVLQIVHSLVARRRLMHKQKAALKSKVDQPEELGKMDVEFHTELIRLKKTDDKPR